MWAWKRRRIHRIARLCDRVLGIFPFEPEFYAHYGYRCTYVGNPTMEEVCQCNDLSVSVCERSVSERQRTVCQPEGRSIVLLPGSRLTEVTHCLPVMLEAARRMDNYRIIVTAAPGLDEACYTPFLRDTETLTRDTYAAIRTARMAIVNSGTATLETALLGCPQVAVYYLAWSRLIALIRPIGQRLMFSIRHFTPVNILLGREAIRELVANDFTADRIESALHDLQSDDAVTEAQTIQQQLAALLGTQSASATAAKIIANETNS